MFTTQDPVGCVKKLAQFLCLTVSDELCSQIAEACSFDNMKNKEAEKDTPDYGNDVITRRLTRQPDVIYKKGTTVRNNESLSRCTFRHRFGALYLLFL